VKFVSAGAEIGLLHLRIVGETSVLDKTLLPTCGTVAKSDTSSASSIDCSASRMVSPSLCSRSKVSYIDSTTAGARPSDGSSSIKSLGSLINARPTASICRSPPDMVPAHWLRRSASFGKIS